MHLLFVFGTLKRGFPLHGSLRGAGFRGLARTVDAFPMFVAGAILGPMMLDHPGRGLPVLGELFAVSAEGLARADRAEANDKPGNFRRPIAVIGAGGARLEALAFFKDPRLAQPRRTGYLRVYRDGHFQPPGQRPLSVPPLRLLSRPGA